MTMKNDVESEIVLIRIPSELAEEIDYRIKSSKLYSNRPDYIIASLRQAMNEVYSRCMSVEFSEGKYELTTPKKQKDDILLKFYLGMLSYKEYKGPVCKIYLRLPIGFKESWVAIAGIFGDCSFQNFIRYTLPMYVMDKGIWDIKLEDRILRGIQKVINSKSDLD